MPSISSGVATVSGGWAVEQGHGGFAEVAAVGGLPLVMSLDQDVAGRRTTPTPSRSWSRTSDASSSCAPGSRRTAADPARPPGYSLHAVRGRRTRSRGTGRDGLPHHGRRLAAHPARHPNNGAQEEHGEIEGGRGRHHSGRDFQGPLGWRQRGRGDSPTPCSSRRGRTTPTAGSELVVKHGRRRGPPAASPQGRTHRRRSRSRHPRRGRPRRETCSRCIRGWAG